MKKINWGLIALQIVVIGVLALVLNYPAETAGALMAVGLQIDPNVICGGGMALASAAGFTADFEEKVLNGIKFVTDKYKELERQLMDPDHMPASVKKAIEDLRRVANEQHVNVERFQKSIGTIRETVYREKALAFGDPIQRVTQDEELRTRLNCAVRLAVDHKGDMRALVTPQLKALGTSYDELLEKHAVRMQEKAGLGEDASPGSLLINDQLSKELYSTLPNYGIFNTLGVQPMGTKTTKFTVDTADPVAQFILTEGGDIDDDANNAGSQVTCTAEVCAVLLNVTLQLIQDGEIDIAALVMKKFGRAYAKRIDHAAFTADGTADATNGGFTGLFNCGTAAAAGAGNTSVERTTLDDWIRCLTTVDAEVLNRQPKFWLHPHILARSLSVKDGNGRPIFLTAIEAPSFGAVGSILGYPVVLGNICPSANVPGSKIAAFGDGESVVVGMRSDYSFDSSDHHKWNSLKRSFRAWGRVGVKGRAATAAAILTTAAG